MNEQAAAISPGGTTPQALERSGISLALSGGGFRATLFHCGALRRLNELGILSQITTIASVSGGSIASGILAMKWPTLAASQKDGVFTTFDSQYCTAIHDYCRKDLRTKVIFQGQANPLNWFKLASKDYSITDLLRTAYSRDLGMDVPLHSLPENPKFLFMASNLETGAGWRFESGPSGVVGDYYTGFAPNGDTQLATAVAASSAFPIVFPPLVLNYPDPKVFQNAHPRLHQIDESKKKMALTDGGVYDNIGIEPIWLHSRHVLVSDAGRPFTFDGDPGLSLKARLARVFDITGNQVEAVRKRWLISQLQLAPEKFQGAYWGIGSDIAAYEHPGAQGFQGDLLDLFRGIRTDLDSFSEEEIGCLENHGYALADVAVQKWESNLIKNRQKFEFPFPNLVDPAAVRKALAKSAERGIIADVWNSLKGDSE